MLMILLSSVALAGATVAPDQPALSLSYRGDTLIHPGGAAGIELPLAGKGGHQLMGAARLGGYYHRRSLTALSLETEGAWRITAPVGLTAEIGAGVGYQHTWLDGEVETEDGSKKSAGRPHLMPQIALGTGWDFATRDLAPLRLFARVDLSGTYPVSRRLIPHLAFELGAAWRF